MDKKEQAAQKFKERTASKRFKLPEGNTTFRVLPNAKGLEKAEYIEYRMHSNVGARNAYLRCGKNMRNEGECWLCDTLIPKLEKSGKSSHRKLGEALKAKDCFAVQIIYKSEGKWMGPTLWEMSPGVANRLLGVMSRRNVSHPEKGYNLTISRTGTTMTSTKYGDIDRDDEKSEVPENLLTKLKPFGEVLKKYDEKVMKTEYYGHEQDEDEPEEEEEETKKKGEEDEEEEEKPKSKKKPAEDEDEAEEEEEAPKSKKKKPSEEEEEEAEEEEEKPKSKKKKPVDADEDETEEATEEEEEEKPKSKKKPKDEDEDETEEDETEEEIPDLEEEEEEKPKSKKKPKDEDEEDESESAEDEEEEKPKSKKKPKPDEDEEEEEEKPKSKKKPSRDEDDD